MQMMHNLSFLGMFLVALSMSLGHCVGMCGGIVSAFLPHSVCKERLVFDGMEIALKKAGILECK
ncbi:hypothetical protein Hpoki52_09910 [Helicobacter pylori]